MDDKTETATEIFAKLDAEKKAIDDAIPPIDVMAFLGKALGRIDPATLERAVNGLVADLSKKHVNIGSTREVLPMSTGMSAIRRNQTTAITARPQRLAFRPERLFISNSNPAYKGPWWKRLSPWYQTPLLYGAADWTVNELTIGNRSQFSQQGNLPGDMFATTAIGSFFSFGTCQTAMDVVLTVTYTGACPTGHVFSGGMLGTAAVNSTN
jgi:hypothetical protein